jgi:PleD family two-component response regulator
MPVARGPSRSPLILIANAQEWVTRSLDSILCPAGYAVLRAYTGRDALESARRSSPDVVILDSGLPETDVLALCRALRVDPYLSPSTPIFVTALGPLSRPQVLDALRAGANGVWGQPLDTEEFLLRLEGHVRAKLDADAAREGGLLDPRTGLYNARGLARRARELAAQADRRDGSLACLALAPQASGPALVESLACTLRAAARASDAIGRVGPREFAVLAPDTDGAGAVKLFRRLVDALAPGSVGPQPLRLRGGYDARSGLRAARLDPTLLLGHALQALRAVEAEEGAGHGAIRPFAGRPTPQRSAISDQR